MVLLLAGCTKTDKANPKIGQTDFIVALDVQVLKDDHLAMYYTTDGTINFFTHPAIWKSVKGQPQLQRVVFTVPKKIIPTQIRLDFGMNQQQPNVVLKRIELRYNGKTFSASGPEIFKYFQPDKHLCLADIATGTIKALTKDGKRSTPAFYPNGDQLEDEIDKLTR